jgi:hypothetical protein
MSDLNATSGSDDSGSESTYYENDGTSSSSNVESPTPDNSSNVTTNAGTTIAGKSGNSTQTTNNSKPGRRLYNPLGDFSSYTYQVSLYLITPDAYNAFVSSGRKNINAISNVANNTVAQQYGSSKSGVYLIAQSGGINNSTSTRAPGFGLDYYIDNLEISSAVAMGKSDTGGAGPTNTMDCKFQIIEPYGFSFIQKLKGAVNELIPQSKLPNVGENLTPDKQFYILGIRFLGYDANGEIVNGSDGSFTTYYDIAIQEIKFKLDGKAVVYNIKANGVGTVIGMGLKNGRIQSDTTAVGYDVESMINSLFANINKTQNNNKNAKAAEIPDQYEIKFIGPDADLIRTSSVVNMAADSDKNKYPALEATQTDKITVKDEIETSPDSTQRVLTFKGAGSTSILDAIQNIIKQSDYIQQAIKNLYKNETEPDKKTKDLDTATTNANRVLKWINVSTEILNLGFDTVRNDWAYKITYIVQSYDAPAVNVIQAGKTPLYYGPSKRYSYWFTGKNSEITKFELNYNSLYTTIALSNIDDQSKVSSPVPTTIGQKVQEQRLGRTGAALESQNAYINYLNDASAYALAYVTILGDPDYLVDNSSSTVNEVYDKFYGTNGYTINANGGQVFIEIDFKEAEDYDHTTGVLSVNDKILFWDYPQEYKEGPNKIQGIAFNVSHIVSNFRAGKFEQTLTLVADFWPTPITPEDSNSTSANSAGNGRLNSYTDPRSTLYQPPGSGAGAGRGGNSYNDPRSTLFKGSPDSSANQYAPGGNLGFPKAPAIQNNTVSQASSPTSNPPADLNAQSVQIASINSTPQVTSPTGGLAQSAPVADGDSEGQGLASNNTTNLNNVNISDAGRETSDNVPTFYA